MRVLVRLGDCACAQTSSYVGSHVPANPQMIHRVFSARRTLLGSRLSSSFCAHLNRLVPAQNDCSGRAKKSSCIRVDCGLLLPYPYPLWHQYHLCESYKSQQYFASPPGLGRAKRRRYLRIDKLPPTCHNAKQRLSASEMTTSMERVHDVCV